MIILLYPHFVDQTNQKSVNEKLGSSENIFTENSNISDSLNVPEHSKMQGDILRLQSIRIFLGGQILTVKSKNYRRGFSLFYTKNTDIATLGCHFTCTQFNLSHRESRPKNLDRIYIKLCTLAPFADFQHSCAT